MTLRARLTVAFLAVVLGPVLVGAAFVGGTVTAVDRSRAVDRLAAAASALDQNLAALCDRLGAAAQLAAVDSAGGARPDGAAAVLEQGMASTVRLDNTTTGTLYTRGPALPGPWADCQHRPPAGGTDQYVAVAARVTMLDGARTPIGYAYAAQAVDATLLRQLAAGAGASVTVLGPDGTVLSTERADRARHVVSTATALAAGEVGRTADRRYVRVVDPDGAQPLRVLVSVAGPDLRGLYLVLVLVVLLVAALAVVLAAGLARTATRPLAELARATHRVARGDLAARVPVRSRDEVGRLAETFNRMAREMQTYVGALTASRDQLRSNLGLLGETLSSTHDLDRMLQVILHTAMAATGAQAGVMLLVDEAGQELVGQCGEGLGPRGVPDPAVRLPLGHGLLGTVAATGEARRGRVGRNLAMFVAAEPTCRTYMAVPFAAPDAGTPDGEPPVRGVLALYDRLGRDEFDDADLDNLCAFAAQAAVAVRNVRVHEEARRLSHTDSLTGLFNHRTLTESLRREVERASRFGHQLCVLALDLDMFKDVNDSYGHAAGDAVLVEFARRLRGEIREVDLAFRQGGEEFVILLPETDAIGGITLAQRLGDAVRQPPMSVAARRTPSPGPMPAQPAGPGQPPTPGPRAAATRPLRVPVTVSIGIAVYPEHGATGQAVLGAADDALYAAKAAGRDTYRLAAPGTSTITESGGTPALAVPAGGAPGGPQAARQPRGR